MVKLICEKCGEIPIPFGDIPKEIENSETAFKQFEKKLIGNSKCARCGNKIKLDKGNLTSKVAIEKSGDLLNLMNRYAKNINFDELIHDSNEIVIDRIVKEFSAITSLFYYKNILCFVLVGENTPDGCITYNTKTLYSGIYTMFSEIKNSLLKNSIDAIKTSQQSDKKLPANKIINLLDLERDNKELNEKLKTIEKEHKLKLHEHNLKINNLYSELSQKQKEVSHFKELYKNLKENLEVG